MPQETEKPIVEIHDLRKSFGKQVVLDGISLTVARGEMLAVMGRSGTGKSVLLKLLIGLQKPDNGSIQVAGQDINQIPPDQLNEVRKKMGFLFQQAALYDSMTVEENVGFPLRRHSNLPEAEQQARVRDLLQRIGMGNDGAKLPSQISGGMQKRVGLARALALEPELLLCDEPTSGLDPITAAEIVELVLDLKKERNLASIVVTHDVPAALAFSDRLAILDQGKFVIEGTADDLLQSKDEFVTRFLHEVREPAKKPRKVPAGRQVEKKGR